MNKKPKKSWGEIQLAIAAIAMTGTLALWNMFATPDRQKLVTQSIDTATPPPPDVPTQALTPTPGFVPVKIIFSGVAPQQKVVIQSSAAQVQPKRKSGGGGGAAPAPVTNTGSSKP